MRTTIPVSHPRFKSLYTRELLVSGFRKGLVAAEGLIAHGRGEAFDYLLGERTTRYSVIAINAASCALLLASYPVVSINGNFTALCSNDIIKLGNSIPAFLEINLFYRSPKRERLIEKELKRKGAEKILGTKTRVEIPGISSDRKFVDGEGIYKADVVFVSLEDGDRCEALRSLKKFVIAVDLNPLSRTARTANITIVDNVTRVIPKMISTLEKLRIASNECSMKNTLKSFDNKRNLKYSLDLIKGGYDKDPEKQ
jgi:4-phosphopantoate--beta-alanine ligase